jgi:alkylation response protein AidB-like acyl-CoA dehydrogenase
MIRDQETLNILLDSVRRFVREQLVPREQEVADTDQIPPAIVAQMRELGLFGLCIPEQYGGLALTMEEEVMVAFEIARTSPRLPLADRHQQRHRLARHPDRRHRRTERTPGCRAWPPATSSAPSR